jgi:ABC-type polysaccharide/polyol phosphate transport system ATPase subunit
MPPAIVTTALGKRYALRHQQREQYGALRDVLTSAVRELPRRLIGRAPKRETREEFWALRDVALTIAEGERVGIIGRNGAGKSTLLKLLSRITEPTTGSIRVRGRVASMLEVGTGFHPELTGRENVYLNGAILGMSRGEIARKFDEIVAFAEVEKFLDTPTKRYSSGMYLRLAFAVAAHLEPDILVVDEVLAVGDAQFQKKCLGKMQESGREGRTVLFVSHNMAAIEGLCTRAVVLDGGRVVGVGDVAEQIAWYMNTVQALRSALDRHVRIGSLTLEALEVTPNPVESCRALGFSLSIRSSAPARIEGLALLINSGLGARFAIVDLRTPDAYVLEAGEKLAIRGRVPVVPLVEGEYVVGLYVRSGEVEENLMDLVTLNVTAMPSVQGLVPYSPRVRGVAQLIGSFEADKGVGGDG